jgi:glycosyltransferase involved in cell wall biosynthesis
MDKRPLLSIFIPTKNGVSTIASAIESCLSNKRPDLEVIVHDCSDDYQIKQFIDKNWQHESRLKYYYSEKNLSMTDNFNEALSKCSGRYVCGIGDDDAVLQNIMSIVDWMEINGIESIKQPMTNYFWPSSKALSLFNGKLRYSKIFDGHVYNMDIKRNFIKITHNCGFGYVEGLPSVYHAIVKLEPIQIHYKKTGHFFRGTSFDVYCACTLPTYLNNTYRINIPFSIFGAGPNSNTMKNINAESLDSHYDDFSHVSDFAYLPNLRNSEVSTAESFIEALIDTGNPYLIDKMNLAVIYGKCAADRPELFFSLFKYFMSIIDKKTSIFSFLNHFLLYFFRRLRSKIKMSITGICYRSFPVIFEIIIKKYSKSKVVAADNIIEAVNILEKEISLSEINLSDTLIEH